MERAVRDGHPALRQRLSAALGLAGDATIDSLVGGILRRGSRRRGRVARLRSSARCRLDHRSDARRNPRRMVRGGTAERASMIDDYVDAYLNEKATIRQNPPDHQRPRRQPEAGCDGASDADGRGRTGHADSTGCAPRSSSARRPARWCGSATGCCANTPAPSGCAGVLDFDDLVARALALLRRPGVAPWVLFKLDGGLDHILIDEAQDTNPEQWEIVAALAEEFFAGEGARGPIRTVFAVGDAKQSIYSFQRADPQAFLRMRQHFQQRVAAAKQDWRELPLDISFRSTEPLLRAVDAVFRQPEARHGVALDGGDDPPYRRPRRAGRAGRAVAAGRPRAGGRTRRRRIAGRPQARSPSLMPGSPARSPRRSRNGLPPASACRRATGRCGPATSWCWCADATNSSTNCCAR